MSECTAGSKGDTVHCLLCRSSNNPDKAIFCCNPHQLLHVNVFREPLKLCLEHTYMYVHRLCFFRVYFLFKGDGNMDYIICCSFNW